ncbi:ABC transporter permease [Candidatus Bathyarchaeota archaeon]|nr:ABC transporter permease [Candidatus Bathyarchaeota archaeon]
MIKYVVRRLLLLPVVVLGATIIVFVTVRVVPGDPALAAVGFWSGKEQVELARKLLRLDLPIHIQYFLWLSDVFRGDLGKSFFSYKPVSEELIRRLPITAELSFFALIVGISIGIPAGVISAVKRGSFYDKIARFFGVFGFSIAEFWLGMMLVIIFAVMMPLLPPGGYVELSEDPIRHLRGMILPSLSLGLPIAAIYSRMTRSSMLEVLMQDYIRTARAKGLYERMVIYKHALRNAFIPLITILGMNIGYLMSGAVLIETIFGLPGVGSYLYEAIISRDFPIIQGTVLVIALIFVLSNLLVDITYSLIDPRIRHGKEE